MDLTLLVMAAGIGSRFGGLKQLHPFGNAGEVLLDYAVFNALRAGFNNFVFIIRPEIEEDFKSLILARFPASLPYSLAYQTLENVPYPPASISGKRQKPWGTAHAIWSARHLLKTPFAAINGDDFYGRNTFEQLATFFKKSLAEQYSPFEFNHHACITFPLRNTLSPYGAVSRGVCELNAQRDIRSVTEYTQITLDTAGKISQKIEDSKTIQFTGEEEVSVNCWGFWPSFLEYLETAVIDFFRQPELGSKEECLLPSVVNDLIQARKVAVKALQSEDKWAGVTYREDVQWVKEIINGYTTQGAYPAALWKESTLK